MQPTDRRSSFAEVSVMFVVRRLELSPHLVKVNHFVSHGREQRCEMAVATARYAERHRRSRHKSRDRAAQ